MKRFLLSMLLLLPVLCDARQDTLWVSDHYTTHIIFSDEISYADLSNQKAIAAKVVDKSRNKLAIKARQPFGGTASVSVEEGGGVFHTFVVAYREYPDALIVDYRPEAEVYDMTRMEVIEVSDIYTTHLIFTTDVIYAETGNPRAVVGHVVKQGRNKIAIKAKEPMTVTTNITVEEANGMFHNYILKYKDHPDSLIYDTRDKVKGTVYGTNVNTGSLVRNSREREATATQMIRDSGTNLRRADAPLLREVAALPQELYHIGSRKYGITLICENIFSYSDITYFILRLDNNSHVSYESDDATFVVESNNGAKRRIAYEKTIFPKNKFGNFTVGPKNSVTVAYSLDKLTLSDGQRLKIYLYEKGAMGEETGGSRNLVLTLSAADINGATSPIK